MKTGFIGLGNLGSAMAKRLIEEGDDLVLWNRTKSKAEKFNKRAAQSPKKLAEEVELIFINLFDSAAVHEVLFGKEGLFEVDLTGKIIVDTTTNHPEWVVSFHKEARSRGARYLESPVLGSVAPALQGALTILVSGERESYEKVYPYLAKLGKAIFYLEKEGLATKMKLINNMILGTFMATIGEALAFADGIGIEREKALEIFANGAGNSLVLNAKREKLLREDFSPHFSVAAIYKDLHYLEDLAFSVKKPIFLGSLTKELFAKGYKSGLENQDFSVIYKILRDGN